VNEGDLLEFSVTASDPDGNALTYAASNLPSGANFDPFTQLFSWTPENWQVGNYSDVTFSVSDDGNPPMVDSEIIILTVGDVNRPPTLDPIGHKTVHRNELLEFALTASDPDGGPLTYSATNLPEGATFDPVAQLFSWTPGYGQEGSHSVTFTVTDGGTPQESDSEDVTITVGDLWPRIVEDIRIVLTDLGTGETAKAFRPGARVSCKVKFTVYGHPDKQYKVVAKGKAYSLYKPSGTQQEWTVKLDDPKAKLTKKATLQDNAKAITWKWNVPTNATTGKQGKVKVNLKLREYDDATGAWVTWGEIYTKTKKFDIVP
jgi:hypothetical protein